VVSCRLEQDTDGSMYTQQCQQQALLLLIHACETVDHHCLCNVTLAMNCSSDYGKYFCLMLTTVHCDCRLICALEIFLLCDVIDAHLYCNEYV